MNPSTIQCPECHANITLGETFAAEHIEAERARHRQAITELKSAYQQKEAAVAEREEAIKLEEDKLQEKLAAERECLAKSIEQDIRQEMQLRLSNAEKQLSEKDQRLRQAQSQELESLKRVAEADEKLRQNELEVQRKLAEERNAIREQTLRESSEDIQRKMAEKDQIIEQMNRRIEKLHRQADSKSQQLQGDLEENSIYTHLREHFPDDDVARIPRGRNGADIVFRVKSPSGKIAGTVLIEVKDTQHFSRQWIPKLKNDAHEQNADIAVIVSRSLPDNIESFAQQDDVWVCRAEVLIPLMTALRSEVINVARERSKTALSDSTRDVVFQYLISAQFTRRVTMMVESYNGMRQSLDKQKRQFQQRMAEQERALDKMIAGVAGVYSDLNVRAGSALKPVNGLELDDDIDSLQSTLALSDKDTINDACVN